MTMTNPPEFGPNGAVLNSPALGDDLRAEYRGEPPVPQRWTYAAWGLTFASMVSAMWTVWPFEPVWARLAASVFLVAGFARSFYTRGRLETWFWATGWVFILGLLIWNAFGA